MPHVARAAILAILTALSGAPTMAQPKEAGLKLCNAGNGLMEFAYIQFYHELFGLNQTLKGWNALNPGQCQTIAKPPSVNAQIVLSIRDIRSEGKRLSLYGTADIPEFFLRSATYPIEAFYCIPDAPSFHNARYNRDAPCAEGGYSQLFTQLVFVEQYIEFTLNIK